mmetsp:Transcript_47630/g.55682  ORF Transcript_47630/g.55682 Transcript_47630/m.55682 type:complete len:142 (+) Transcript_47630:149-574(+)
MTTTWASADASELERAITTEFDDADDHLWGDGVLMPTPKKNGKKKGFMKKIFGGGGGKSGSGNVTSLNTALRADSMSGQQQKKQLFGEISKTPKSQATNRTSMGSSSNISKFGGQNSRPTKSAGASKVAQSFSPSSKQKKY